MYIIIHTNVKLFKEYLRICAREQSKDAATWRAQAALQKGIAAKTGQFGTNILHSKKAVNSMAFYANFLYISYKR